MIIRDIQTLVCARFGISHLDLVSDRRGRAEAWPRQAAIWLCRHATPHTLVAIGRAFGNRDHTTVIQAIRRVNERMGADPVLAAWLMATRDSLTRIEELAA
jgi:chromosomal replication initiator protein